MPIKRKLILAYTVSFGLLISVFAFIIYEGIKHVQIERLDTRIKSYAMLLQDEIKDELTDGYLDQYNIRDIPKNGLKKISLEIIQNDGKVLLKDSIFNHVNISPKTELNKSTRKSFEFEGNHYRYFQTSKNDDQKYGFTLAIIVSKDEEVEDLNELLFMFILIIPTSLILTGIIAYLLSKTAFKPVTEMVKTAQNISAKNLDEKINLPNTKDEIYELGFTLNEMIKRISGALKSQKQFIANASHEIRTPLTIMQTELELAHNKIADDELRNSVDIVLNEIDTLSKLTDSLLLLANIDSLKYPFNPEIVRLDELILECIQSLNKIAEQKNIRLNPLLDEPIELFGDKEKLKRIFINLLDNAIKYSFEKSVVGVEVLKVDNNVEIKIKNNGHGIPENEIPKIFQRFYRSSEVRSKVKGSGLGLSIVKELVLMHGGSIKVDSVLNKETIFSVILPQNVQLHHKELS
jgi:signal transduction histidine kinase